MQLNKFTITYLSNPLSSAILLLSNARYEYGLGKV